MQQPYMSAKIRSKYCCKKLLFFFQQKFGLQWISEMPVTLFLASFELYVNL